MTEHRYLVTYPEDDWLVDYFSSPLVVEMFIDPWYIVDHHGVIVQLDVRRASRRVLLIRETEGEVSTYSPPRGIIDSTEMTIHRALDPGTLIFRTTSSHFAIARRREESHASIHHGLFDILSASSPPIWVGTAVLPLDITLPTSLEFIVLSRTGMRGAYDVERLEYYHDCLLHVMAVSENEGLMERVGLGVIHEVAWIASRAEEKVVFLR